MKIVIRKLPYRQWVIYTLKLDKGSKFRYKFTLMVKKNVQLPAYVRPERYKIILRPDLEKFIFQGEETIFLTLEEATTKIKLHADEIEIDEASFTHKNLRIPAQNISCYKKSETVKFTFPHKLPKGKGELYLKFKGVLNDKMRGFYRSKYTVGGVEKYMATTQFEATDARRAFPCIDEPAAKAIFDVTLMVPSHTTVISNTVETVVSEHESGYKVVEFAPTPKMSTYLLAFMVGEFEYVEDKTKEGIVVRVFTTPGKKEQAKFALEVAKKIMSFYQEYFEIPYPLPVIDLIAIPDFAAGAMENWGAVTYRESALLVDPDKTSTQDKQWVALVIAHELAHQWFGNLVTMEWWTHLWLNEGFASYIEYLAVDHLFPEWQIWAQFVYTEYGEALSLDGLANTHPIEVEVHHPKEISEIFDKVSYSKGASMIRMLAEYLGFEGFRDGLRHYLKKHQFANASTEDLWLALEEVTGKPVRKLMYNWTSKPGHPVIKVVEKDKNLQLSQSRFFLSPISKKESQDKTSWSVPLKVLTKGQKDPQQYLLDRRSLPIPGPKKIEWIKINAGEISFTRVDYPVQLLRLFKEPLERKILPSWDRLGIIRDAFDLAQAGELPTDQALKLVEYYQNEDEFVVWAEIASHLRQLDSLLAKEDFYDQYQLFGRQMFLKIAAKMGWQEKKTEKHTDKMLRMLVLSKLGSFGDEPTIEKAVSLFEKVLSGKAQVSPDLRSVIYNLTAENGRMEVYQSLVKRYVEEESQQEKDRLARALTLFKDQSILQKTLQFTLSDQVRFQDTPRIIASLWFNPKGRDLTWEFIKKHWQVLRERYEGGFLLARLLQGAGEFTEVAKAKEVTSFFKKNPTVEAKRTVAQAIEQIYSNSAWLKRDRQKIKDFLDDSQIG